MIDLITIGYKQILKTVLVIACILMSFVAGEYCRRPSAIGPPPLLQKAGPPMIQLDRIGELAPVRVHVTDVLIAEGDGYRGAWLIKGDALITCDISHAKLTDIDTESRTARLQLPALRVASARVDFEKTKTWNVEKTTWLPWAAGDQGVFRDAALFHAQKLVEDAARSRESFEAARGQTELIIQRMYRAVSWSVDVGWAG